MAESRDIFIRGARTLDAPTPLDIHIRNGVIVAARPAGQAIPPGAEVIAGQGRLAVPGYVNGHVHSHELYFRGLSEKLRLEEWMNSVRPVHGLPLTPRDVYVRTRLLAWEALAGGTTTICDDVGIDPAQQPEHLAAVVAGYRDAGIRAFVGPTLYDIPFARAVPFADEELPADRLAAIDAASRSQEAARQALAAFEDFSRDLAAQGGRVQAIAAPSAPQRCSAEFLKAVRAVADRQTLPLMIHIHETRTQAADSLMRFGESAFARLERLGILAPRTSLIHCVWISDEDLARVARAGASIQHNPASNLKLGSGVAPVQAMIAAGINVSLASDGCGSIDNVSIQTNVMLAALISTLRGAPDGWLSAAEVFEAATLGGARALGLDHEIGRIEAGYGADIVLYRLDRPSFAPLNDALRQLVYGDQGRAVETVIVDGRVVLSGDRLAPDDADTLLHEARAIQNRLAPHIARATEDAAALVPGMRRICERCAEAPLAGSVYPARFSEPNPPNPPNPPTSGH